MRLEAIKRLEEVLLNKRRSLHETLGNGLEVQQCQTVTSDSISEGAQVSEQNEITLQLASVETNNLNQINEALNRIKKGNYGVCEGCQNEIPLLRLTALPFATHCLVCQEAIEEGRPIPVKTNGHHQNGNRRHVPARN